VPAGLVDDGETPEQCAVRELKEETGYVGVAEKTSAIMYNGTVSFLTFHYWLTCPRLILDCLIDPGFCNVNLNMVHIRVDMSLPANQNPQPELEENEFIECFTVPLATLFEETKKLEEQGYAIDARVGTLAEGIELARRFAL
jgi:ADP-ribose pyrophosphatase